MFGVGSATYTQIMTTPGFMDTDINMLALTAGSYWSQRVTNTNADALDEGSTAPPNFINRGTLQAPNWKYVQGSNLYTDNITLGIASDAGSFVRRFDVWKRNVGLAYTGGNPYESMREALSRVGIRAVNAAGYESQFGIALRVPKPMDIGGGARPLMAYIPQIAMAESSDSMFDDAMRALLTQTKNMLGFTEGDYSMLMADQPNIPPTTPPMVMMVRANQPTVARRPHVLGICDVVNLTDTGQALAAPVVKANGYFSTAVAKIDYATAKVTVLQRPKHGRLEPVSSDGDWRDPRYLPNDGYLGKDYFVLQVEGGGHKVQLRYFLAVSADRTVKSNPDPVCKAFSWKISTTGDGSLDLQDNASNDPGNDTLSAGTANSGFPFGPLSSNHEGVRYAGFSGPTGATADSPYTFNNISVTFAALEGQVVGTTVGVGPTAQITLDTDAAGHGWFIDATPSTNEEFLPTADPTVWQARAGTAAAGKMDMLSVLLHEYGHALGLEHSGAASDFMSAALQPGGNRG